jgi:hypothetical protein
LNEEKISKLLNIHFIFKRQNLLNITLHASHVIALNKSFIQMLKREEYYPQCHPDAKSPQI